MNWGSTPITTTRITERVADMIKADHNEGPECREGTDHRGCLDRRMGEDQAVTHTPGFIEQRTGQERRRVLDRRLGLERRRGPGKRRSDDRRAAEEGQMSDEQFDFLMAIDEYKKANARPFPTWTEVLEIIKALGYRKVADPQPLGKSATADPVEP